MVSDQRFPLHRQGETPADGGDPVAAALVRAGRGDQAAFGVFYDAVAATVYGIILRVIRNPALAEEVTQEVFVELWKQAARFDPARGNAKSWAATIAHHRAVDRVRSEQAARDREIHNTVEAPQTGDVVGDAVVEEMTANLERERVTVSLQQLSEVQREAVTLAYYGGHTYREVAALLNTPEGTIKTRIRDGLSKLRNLMEQPS